MDERTRKAARLAVGEELVALRSISIEIDLHWIGTVAVQMEMEPILLEGLSRAFADRWLMEPRNIRTAQLGDIAENLPSETRSFILALADEIKITPPSER